MGRLERRGATRETLSKLARRYFDPASAVLVVVGPRAALIEPLRAIGYGVIEARDADGKVLAPKGR